MAVTGVITLSDGSANVAPEAVISAVLVLTNDGAAVNLVGFVPTAVTPAGGTAQTGSVALSDMRPSLPQVVPASSTLTVTFDVVAHAPKKAGPSTLTYGIGATCRLSDGSIIYATPDTLTVAAPA